MPPEVEQEIKNVGDCADEDCAVAAATGVCAYNGGVEVIRPRRTARRNIERNRGPKYAGTLIWRMAFVSGSGRIGGDLGQRDHTPFPGGWRTTNLLSPLFIDFDSQLVTTGLCTFPERASLESCNGDFVRAELATR